jgi:hypothetical protein
MATERQIRANRANAKRSTGPVTEKSKQASSRNALRHGQLSSCVVLKAESVPVFDALMNSLIEEFQPTGENELALLESMAVARWKLTRNWTLHTALLELETVKQDPNVGSDPIITALAFKSLADSSNSLQLLHRYEVSFDRQYSRALNNLLKLRAARVIAPAATSIEGAGAAEEVETEPIPEFPNKPNLPLQPPGINDKGSVTTARNPVAVLHPKRISTPIAAPLRSNRTVPTPPKPNQMMSRSEKPQVS